MQYRLKSCLLFGFVSLYVNWVSALNDCPLVILGVFLYLLAGSTNLLRQRTAKNSFVFNFCCCCCCCWFDFFFFWDQVLLCSLACGSLYIPGLPWTCTNPSVWVLWVLSPNYMKPTCFYVDWAGHCYLSFRSHSMFAIDIRCHFQNFWISSFKFHNDTLPPVWYSFSDACGPWPPTPAYQKHLESSSAAQLAQGPQVSIRLDFKTSEKRPKEEERKKHRWSWCTSVRIWDWPRGAECDLLLSSQLS